MSGEADGVFHCQAKGAQFEVDAKGTSASQISRVALRPERLRLAEPGQEFLPATVKQVSYLGERCQVIVTHDQLGELLVSCPTWKTGITPRAGLPVSIGWDRDACVPLSND